MGISGLMKLLTENAPGCIKEQKFQNYFGRTLAVDASMHIYQFMAVVGRQGEQQLTNAEGEVTSHLQGLFYRTIRMLDSGIKPVYVFDGKPPELKSGELAKRSEKREEAIAKLEEAKERTDEGAAAEVEKQAKRNLKVTKEHNEECKRLLRLMGVPVVEAPCEAEATCAALCKAGKVFAAASEDMDTLTFGTPRLARNVMAPASAEKPVLEIDVAKALEELGLTPQQFVDVCILCGCDYCPSIRGIGPSKALGFIKKHGDIEGVIESLDTDKYPVPEGWMYKEARGLFLAPDVVDASGIELKWQAPDEEGVVDLLVKEKGFSEERVRAGVKKVREAKGKATQGRMEAFFGAATSNKSTIGVKRKEDPKAKGKGGALAKKSKGVTGGKKR
mmetsp:Transcript_274/g.889  ORF Transcript_274/g.889 Transcript_274/m.889 type:complete len:389 (+) Transcript_274:116-1282(+)